MIGQQIDFSKPYICIGDSSGIKNAYDQIKWDILPVYHQIISKLKSITQQIVFIDGSNGKNNIINSLTKHENIAHIKLDMCNYHELFYVLENAQIFISGRWHASILSILANTPILLWGSDSHKTRALYTLLDYPYKFYDIKTLPVHIDELVEDAENIIANNNKIKEHINIRVQNLSQMVKGNVDFLNKYY